MEIHIKLTIDDRLVAAARSFSRAFSTRRIGLLLALCALSATVVLAAPIERPHTFAAGDKISAAEINESFDVVYDELNARVIRNDLTLDVEDCADLKAKLASLDDKLIASSAVVVLALPEGDLDCSSAITIDHRDGGHIQIIGKGSDKTTLTFFSTDGFVVPAGRTVGWIDELTVQGSDFVGNGLFVHNNANATLGDDVIIREFVDGVHTEGGFVFAEGVISEYNSEDGFKAQLGGTIYAISSGSRDNGTDGYFATLGSAIFADSATATDNDIFGFNANLGSAIQAGNGAASSGGQHGFNANDNSVVFAADAEAYDNSAFGYAAWNGSVIEAAMSSSDDNGTGFGVRFGSYIHAVAPTGNSVTYLGGTPNTFSEAEMSMIQQD